MLLTSVFLLRNQHNLSYMCENYNNPLINGKVILNLGIQQSLNAIDKFKGIFLNNIRATYCYEKPQYKKR